MAKTAIRILSQSYKNFATWACGASRTFSLCNSHRRIKSNPAVRFLGGDMKRPSALGTAIEQAIDRDGRYRRIREPVQYACFYQAPAGKAFAVERVTLDQVRLWLPKQDEDARFAAEKEDITVTKSVPFSNPLHPRKYGRLSSLKSVGELSHAIFYLTAVASVHQALAILGALA